MFWWIRQKNFVFLAHPPKLQCSALKPQFSQCTAKSARFAVQNGKENCQNSSRSGLFIFYARCYELVLYSLSHFMIHCPNRVLRVTLPFAAQTHSLTSPLLPHITHLCTSLRQDHISQEIYILSVTFKPGLLKLDYLPLIPS